MGASALLGADATDPRIDQLVASLIDGRGIPPEDAVDLPITGTPAQAAERFAAYADAGATWLVLGTIGDDWHAQWKLIAQAATLLDRHLTVSTSARGSVSIIGRPCACRVSLYGAAVCLPDEQCGTLQSTPVLSSLRVQICRGVKCRFADASIAELPS